MSDSTNEKAATIAWVGLGAMGVPMARRLALAGYRVRGYNRSRHAVHDTLPFPLFASPAKAVEGADLVVLMVRDGLASRALLWGEGGILSALSPRQRVINMSTIAPDEAREEELACRERNVSYFDIPVSGSVVPAEKGELLLLAGGDESLRSQIEAPLSVLGRSLHWFGQAGSGMAAKLAINFLLGAHMEAIAETLLIGESLGLDGKTLSEALLESPLATPFYRIKVPNLLNEDYRKAFSASLMKKDLDLLLRELLSRDKVLPEPLSHLRSLYQRIVAKGQGEKDLSIIQDLLKSDVRGS